MLKRLFVLVLIFLLGVGATLAYLAWKSGESSAEDVGVAAADIDQARQEIRRRLEEIGQLTDFGDGDGDGGGSIDSGSELGGGTQSGSQVRISESDLNNLLITSLADHPNGRRVLEIAKEIEVEISPDRIELGLVVSVEDLPRENLGAKERVALEQILDFLPMLRERDLYVGIKGMPAARDGAITVGDDLSIRLGFLTLPVGEFADKLGFSTDKIYDALRMELESFEVEDVRAEKEALLLAIRTRRP